MTKPVAAWMSSGWTLVPMRAGEKTPKRKWDRARFKPEDFGDEDNVAVRLSDDVVVLDLDMGEFEDRKRFVDAFLDFFSWKRDQLFWVKTPSGGVHIWLRLPQGSTPFKVERIPFGNGVVEVRSGPGCLVLIPPSVVDGKPYQWGSPAIETAFMAGKTAIPEVDPGRLSVFLGTLRPETPQWSRNEARLVHDSDFSPSAKQIEDVLGLSGRVWRRGRGWTLYHCPIHEPDQHGSFCLWDSGAIRDFHDGKGYNWVTLAYALLGTNDFKVVLERFGVQPRFKSEAKAVSGPKQQSDSESESQEVSQEEKEPEDSVVVLVKIRKYEQIPPRYDLILSWSDSEYELKSLRSQDVLNFGRVRSIFWERFNRMLPRVKSKAWEMTLDKAPVEAIGVERQEWDAREIVLSMIQKLSKSAVPESDATVAHLRTGFIRRESDGLVVFKTQTLAEALRREGHVIVRPELLSILKEIGCKGRNVRVRDSVEWCWYVAPQNSQDVHDDPEALGKNRKEESSW